MRKLPSRRRGSELASPNMLLWCVDYFELKALEKQQVIPNREVGEWCGEGGAGETRSRGFRGTPALRSDVGTLRADSHLLVTRASRGRPRARKRLPAAPRCPAVSSIPSPHPWEGVCASMGAYPPAPIPIAPGEVPVHLAPVHPRPARSPRPCRPLDVGRGRPPLRVVLYPGL